MSTVTLAKKALALPAKRRASLASRLLASLDTSLTHPHAKEWGSEIEARINAFDGGRLAAVSAVTTLSHRGKSLR
jgi:hypothetical protein